MPAVASRCGRREEDGASVRSICMYVYTYVCMYVCMYTYVCMYVCMYVCYIHTYLERRIIGMYIHTNIRIDTCILLLMTHTYIYINAAYDIYT
jgi:hypothetical protein